MHHSGSVLTLGTYWNWPAHAEMTRNPQLAKGIALQGATVSELNSRIDRTAKVPWRPKHVKSAMDAFSVV
jgi:hypothetical protein